MFNDYEKFLKQRNHKKTSVHKNQNQAKRTKVHPINKEHQIIKPLPR